MQTSRLRRLRQLSGGSRLQGRWESWARSAPRLGRPHLSESRIAPGPIGEPLKAKPPSIVSAMVQGQEGMSAMTEQRHDETVDHLLGELEAAIMRLMWTVDAATVRDIHDLLRAAGRSLAYTTVMTVMARLTEKALLSRELSGKTHVYQAAMTEDQFVRATAAKRVQALVDEFGDVAIAQFVVAVSVLSPERNERLERIARGELR